MKDSSLSEEQFILNFETINNLVSVYSEISQYNDSETLAFCFKLIQTGILDLLKQSFMLISANHDKFIAEEDISLVISMMSNACQLLANGLADYPLNYFKLPYQ